MNAFGLLLLSAAFVISLIAPILMAIPVLLLFLVHLSSYLVTFIGSTVGYGMSSILYRGALDALEDEKISAERRAIIEQLSEKCVQEISTYRTELTAYAERIGNERTEKINTLFENIHDSIFENNMNGFFASMNQLGNVFGVELQFNTFRKRCSRQTAVDRTDRAAFLQRASGVGYRASSLRNLIKKNFATGVQKPGHKVFFA